MKTLYLVRHAKSSWEHDVIDHERPLNNRGFKDADLVSKHLSKSIKLPELVMSSDALRAKTTALIFVENLGLDQDSIAFNNKLYDFSGRNLTDVITSCDDSIDTLMVFGHNHAMTAFVNTYGNSHTDNVATSGFTHIEFKIASWKDLKQGRTKQTVYPKQLKL